MLLRVTVWGALCAALLGCGGADQPPETPKTGGVGGPSTGDPTATSGLPVERYFPLVDGYLYNYETMNETGERGMLVARVHRQDQGAGELRFPSGARRFEYTPEGIRLASGEGAGSFVLKVPLTTGASWRGEHGGNTRVDAVGLPITVMAGSYTDCVRTIEERLGDVPVRFTTTFCPDVGVVLLEATGGMSMERAELKSYAEPVEIGPDGLIRTE